MDDHRENNSGETFEIIFEMNFWKILHSNSCKNQEFLNSRNYTGKTFWRNFMTSSSALENFEKNFWKDSRKNFWKKKPQELLAELLEDFLENGPEKFPGRAAEKNFRVHSFINSGALEKTSGKK